MSSNGNISLIKEGRSGSGFPPCLRSFGLCNSLLLLPKESKSFSDLDEDPSNLIKSFRDEDFSKLNLLSFILKLLASELVEGLMLQSECVCGAFFGIG